MMDLVVSSYTPTISALLRAQKSRNSSSLHVLAVAQPEAIGGLPSLPYAALEVEALHSLTKSRPSIILIGREATVDAVARALKTCTWVHLACHAFQNLDQPTKSAFQMWDAHLTLARIAQQPLDNAQFAFLSACQSAKGSISLPNESVHIAAGLQFTGFRSVVGTMWSIYDGDGPFVATRFYEHIFKYDADASNAARALHSAVRQLRDEQVSPARWAPFIHIGI